MANKAKFTKSDVLRAIRGNPDNNGPAIPKGADGNDDWVAALWVDDARNSSHGHIPTIAARLGCSDQTIRNYASRKDKNGNLTKLAIEVQAAIEQEKQVGMLKRADFHHELKTKAELALLTNIEMLDTQAAKFVLERLDKANYSSRSEMTGADGVALYDTDAQNALAELSVMLEGIGKNPSESIISVVQRMKAQIETMKNKGKPDGNDDTHSMERGNSE